MTYGTAGMPGNQRQIGAPKDLGKFPVVGNGLGGLPVRSGQPLPDGTPLLYAEGNSHLSGSSNEVNWVVPEGVTQISVLCVGGGGGGGVGAGDGLGGSTGGSGGGGGALAYATLSVIPGEVLQFQVGARGAGIAVVWGGASPSSQTNGGASYLKRGSTFLCRAQGGVAGIGSTGGAGGIVLNGSGGDGGKHRG